jgi:acetyl esterase/lipase
MNSLLPQRLLGSRPAPLVQTLALTVVLAALPAPLWARAAPPASFSVTKRYEVRAYRNILYHTVRHDPHRRRHRLDVFRPKGKSNCPVLFFVHGGGWVVGGKDDVLGLYGYGTIARCLAQRGLVVVLPNYRLSPGVRHPEHIKDVARAFAWTCRHVKEYGGDPRRIFVGGHSAGGHLVSLLATDETWLKAEGRGRTDIRGVISVSGVYRLDGFHLDLSAVGPWRTARASVRLRPLAAVFGTDPKVLVRASPLTHVRPGLPPFLLLNAGFDYPPLRRMAREFAAALRTKGCPVEVKVVPWRTHETLLFDVAQLSAEAATVEATVRFIDRLPARKPEERPARP